MILFRFARDGCLHKKEINEYLLPIRDKLSLINDSDLRRIALFIMDMVENEGRLWLIIKALFKLRAPKFIDHFVRTIHTLCRMR